MAFPATSQTTDGNAGAAFQSACQRAGLNIGGLSPLAQVQLALANLLVDSPGNQAISTTTAASFGVLAASAITSSGTVKSTSPTDGIGYAAGAGLSVTQTATKTQAVTMSAVVGAITMVTTGLAAAAETTFSLVNAAIGLGDFVGVMHSSGGTSGAYSVAASAVAAGSCDITVGNLTGSALGEAIVLTFVVIKGVVA